MWHSIVSHTHNTPQHQYNINCSAIDSTLTMGTYDILHAEVGQLHLISQPTDLRCMHYYGIDSQNVYRDPYHPTCRVVNFLLKNLYLVC